MIRRSDCAKGLPGERFFSVVHGDAVIRVCDSASQCQIGDQAFDVVVVELKGKRSAK